MRTLSILIVDDHETVRQGMRALLSTRSDWFVCGEAADGLEAVEKAKSLRPDVVLMDISMPRMNGVEASRILRQELPESEVIIVSQNDPAIARTQARAVGAAGYLAKSDLARELIPTLDRLAGHRGAEPTSKGGDNGREYPGSQVCDAEDNSVSGAAVPLESILCTEELHRRPSRPPDYEKESRALEALSQALADSPRTVLQTLADTLLGIELASRDLQMRH